MKITSELVQNNEVKLNEEFEVLKWSQRKELSKDKQKEYFLKLRKHYADMPFSRLKLKFQNFNFMFGQLIIGSLIDCLVDYEVINKHLLPKSDETCIFVSNHLSNLDPILAMNIIDQPVSLMLKHEIWGEYFGWILKHFGIVFVKRECPESRIQAKEESIKLIINGKSVLNYPEGTRNKTDKLLLNTQFGAVSMSQTTSQKIVPLGVTYDKKTNKILIRVGKHMTVDYSDDLLDAKEKMDTLIKKLLLENIEEIKKRNLESEKTLVK